MACAGETDARSMAATRPSNLSASAFDGIVERRSVGSRCDATWQTRPLAVTVDRTRVVCDTVIATQLRRPP